MRSRNLIGDLIVLLLTVCCAMAPARQASWAGAGAAYGGGSALARWLNVSTNVDGALDTSRPRYARVTADQSVLSTGRYTVLQHGGGAVVVVDEVTGQRIPVPSTPCTSTVIAAGGGNLLASCDEDAEILPLPAGPWRAIPITPSCLEFDFGGGPTGSCGLTAVGRHWFSAVATCYHCAQTTYYQNTSTGETGSGATAPNEVTNLSASGLARPLCRPLAVAPQATVTLDGNYVIQQTRRLLIDRCGGPHPVLSVPDAQLVGARPHLLLWNTNGKQRMEGVCLPSRRAFSLPKPPGADEAYATALTLRHIYVAAGTIPGPVRFWRTTWPRCP